MKDKHAGGKWEKDAGKVLCQIAKEITAEIERDKKAMKPLFYTGQEVWVRGCKVPFVARITGPANYEGTVVSLKRVVPPYDLDATYPRYNHPIETGFCGLKGLIPLE